MGKHTSRENWPYYRSLVGWAVPWALGAVVVGVGLWAGLGALSGNEIDKPPATAWATPTSTPTPSETTAPTPKGRRSNTPKSPGDHKKPKPAETELITEGLTVQVLNSTLVAGAARDLAEHLEGLGFSIVAVGDALRGLPRTSVYWSSGEAEPAARRLASRFGWLAGPQPLNLSNAIDLHVVVGADGSGI